VYEDFYEQWKKFTPDIQATLEKDYSMGRDSSTWRGSRNDRRQHTVTFKTQPMTYMVTCGGAIKLSTVVERHAVHGKYLHSLHSCTAKCVGRY
jgi:hypothetical protein